ncbi:MAG: serine hydrolase domain-containing protein [Actinomycetota bacterium]
MPGRVKSRWVIVALLPLIAAVGCGGDAGDGESSTPAESASSSEVAAPTSPPLPPSTGSPDPTPPPPASTPTPPSTPTPTPPSTPTPDLMAEAVEPEPTLTGPELQAIVEDALETPAGTVALADRMVELQVAGAAVVIVVDGEVLTSFAAGMTPSGRPMTTSTLSQVGSVSKTVAALTAATLASGGVIEWDGEVGSVLASYELPASTDATPPSVTFGQLLSHTAATSVSGFLGYESVEDVPDLLGILRGEGNSAPVEIIGEPGAGFLYSGGGYQVAELAMLDATGAASWDELVRRQVLDPLEMADSFYALALTDEQAARATEGSLQGLALPDRWQVHPEGAAAGLWTTADDLGRLLLAIGAALRGDQTALPSAEVRRMMLPVAEALGGAVGTGVFLDSGTEPTRWSHGGRNIGYQSLLAGSADGRFGLAIITNSIPGGEQLIVDIERTVSTALGWS